MEDWGTKSKQRKVARIFWSHFKELTKKKNQIFVKQIRSSLVHVLWVSKRLLEWVGAWMRIYSKNYYFFFTTIGYNLLPVSY
jgi:hypothetical protein